MQQLLTQFLPTPCARRAEDESPRETGSLKFGALHLNLHLSVVGRKMMKHFRGVPELALALALMLAALPAVGQEYPVEPNLYFQYVWARSTASAAAAQADAGTPMPAMGDSQAVSAAYMTIANAGAVGVRLVAAESPVAEVVEIHETQMDGDVMMMRPVENGIDVLSGEVTVLEPRGLHMMLMGLTEPLEAGQAVPLTLTFVLLDVAGEPTDQSFTVMVAAPVLDEAPSRPTSPSRSSGRAPPRPRA
jgi:copper(I)-binding protein